jgi:hypothetical protein
MADAELDAIRAKVKRGFLAIMQRKIDLSPELNLVTPDQVRVCVRFARACAIRRAAPPHRLLPPAHAQLRPNSIRQSFWARGADVHAAVRVGWLDGWRLVVMTASSTSNRALRCERSVCGF